MSHPHALRLTPSNSPFFRNAAPRSPTKSSKSEEAGLQLKKVIGTTCATSNGFDCLPTARQFAYTAGAAAVVCTVETDLNVSQRFFRARPSASALRDGASWPMSPTPDLRNKAIGNLRDSTTNASPLGASVRDWPDSPTGKSTTAKDRVKAATSVALSPNGKWVAVGETGYRPRILIFSNRNESSEAPVCALSEHTFGVHALAFSPDSKFLASLGTVNDGFLYIWSVDDRTGAATLHSSNKCTSTINMMTWIGRSVLTIGLRYVKLWKPDEAILSEPRILDAPANANLLTPKLKASEFGNSVSSPRHKVLSGKNSLLGDLIDANFVSAVAFGQAKAIVCAESGEICLLDGIESTQSLTVMGIVGFRVTAAITDGCGTLHLAGTNGQSQRFNAANLEKRGPMNLKRDRRSTASPYKSFVAGDVVTITAIAEIDNILVELDSKRGIRLTKSGDSSAKDTPIASHQLAAHSEAVLGVQCLALEKLSHATFLTFAGNGSVHIWNSEGIAIATLQIPVESSSHMYDLTNELRAVACFQKDALLAAGDKYGTLCVVDILTGSLVSQVRAHSTEIVDVVSFERHGVQLIATASRDRMVQLFSWREGKLEILQTMDEHASALTALTTASGGEYLLSCSTDRTIVVREAMLRSEHDPHSMAYIIMRTITLKSSPLSMCLEADQDEILVSMVDRSICKYNIKTGQVGFSFKCSDSEGGEAAAMSKILYTPSLNGNPTIIGVSSSDKSVRLYSEYGSLIARDWGHTEGITDAALLQTPPEGETESPARLVTVAADSTIFMWDTVVQAPKESPSEGGEKSDTPGPVKSAPLAPPLRKVLSYTELSRFRREKSISEEDPASPPATAVPPVPPVSPHRLKKKSSRSSIMQPPRLEMTTRSAFASSRRESSMRKRSPSPPSPKATKKDAPRKPSLGMSLRSKSSENVMSTYATAANPGFGSVASSTESVCRNLRAYRKKLANASNDAVTPNLLRELATELKLTARVLGEKSQGKVIDEAMMAKLLDQASDRIVDRLDERIKERVESEVVRRSSGNSPMNGAIAESPADIDTVAGALGKVVLD